ncbi:MAG: glycine cleavage system aminomethyltransferase GcvT [Pseudobdellovibrionaceae bacterium]|nr:glycine cleavage system aminomethyltransferase GcvT [Bdellovibrionales bacterium]USN47357.1 MAG: glycine cleavage system aminomethyltransferase GcvT [Pseudobdellovibrionaceae bacterium]
MSNSPKKTPLYQRHVEHGGKLVEFAGWMLPVEYAGLRREHLHVRESVGLFDVSHMGEIRVKGDKALPTLQWLTTNDVSRLEPGRAQYSLLPNEQGGLVDDIIVYCLEKNSDYLVCVNASNTEKDFQWMLKHNQGAEITNESQNWGQIAVQGPKAMALVAKIFGDGVSDLPRFAFLDTEFEGQPALVARTGYTGENGVEIFVGWDRTVQLWNRLVADGKSLSVQPIGLGARDTLRTEMGYSLYGHEIDDAINPYAAGLGWVVKASDKDFLGKGPMLDARERGIKRKLVGLKMLESGIPRSGYHLFSFDNNEIGTVTSGTLSPSLQQGIALAFVDTAFASEGTVLAVQIRQRKVRAQVVKLPFVTPKGV